MQQVYQFRANNHNNSFDRVDAEHTEKHTLKASQSCYNDKFGGKSNQITMVTKFTANHLQKLCVNVVLRIHHVERTHLICQKSTNTTYI